MSDVLVSSLSADGKRVEPLVAGLRAAGIAVWWEGDLAGGEHRQEAVAARLEAARCVVVVWTEASVGPAGDLVQDVAARARTRGILLPVRLDPVAEPLGFGQIQSLDLVGWNGRPRHRRFKEVVAAARAMVAGRPRPQAPKAWWRRRWLAGTAVVAALLPLMSFFSDFHELLAPVCQVAGVRTVCSHWGLGGIPTPEEDAAWTSREAGDCSALRAHLARFPDGAHAQEAERLLKAAEPKTVEHWRAEVFGKSLSSGVRSLSKHPLRENAIGGRPIEWHSANASRGRRGDLWIPPSPPFSHPSRHGLR